MMSNNNINITNDPATIKPTQPIPKKSALIKTDRPRPHVCVICTRAFARLEHLKRHERSHTNEKPFQCAACGRCFARRDLVLRHQQKLHAGLISNVNVNSNPSNGNNNNNNIIDNNINNEDLIDGGEITKVKSRNKNFNSNIIEHKNNTEKIKPLPGQTTIQPLPKRGGNNNNNKTNINPHIKLEEVEINKVHPVVDSDETLTLRNQQQNSTFLASSMDGININNNNNNNNNIEINSNGSDSTSPNDSIYNPFSPSNSLNSMSRSATNDGLVQPPLMSLSNSTNLVNNNGFAPLRKIQSVPQNSNKSSTLSNLNRTNTNFPSDLTREVESDNNNNNEEDDLLASFQMFNNNHLHHHRHASFSASSAISYTLPNEAQSIHDHETIPEAPHQVGFSTPQMIPTDLDVKNNDMNTLGIDWSSLENFSLRNNDNNPDNSGKIVSNHHHNHHNSGYHTMFENSNNNSLENNENYYIPLGAFLHVDGVGGSAGFDSNNNNEIVQSKLKKDEELQENWLDEFIKTPFDVNVDINHIGFVDHHNDSESTLPSPSINSNNNTPTPTNNSAISINNTLSNKKIDQNLSIPNNKKVVGGRISKIKKDKSKIAQTDIPSLFRDRQIDLFQQQVNNDKSKNINNNYSSANTPQSINMSTTVTNTSNATTPLNLSHNNNSVFSMQSSYNSNYKFDLFTQEIRSHIITSNNLQESQFPSIGELNSYIFLFCKEFDEYFPFVHLPSIESNINNIPLLLAVAAIGALYSFHSSNSLLLFGVSKFYIHNFLESNKNVQHDDIPLWLIQCLTLNMFLGIFNNDESLNKSIAKQLNSLIYLVKKCSLHLPLEQFLTPPTVPYSKNNNQNNNDDPSILKDNFDYFILAQSRIRTVHTILLISVLFDTLIGAPIILKSEDIKCGSPCSNELYWKANNFQKWYQLLLQDHIILDSKFTLVSLSNGENFTELVQSLINHDYMDLVNRKVGLKISLSLLMYIHQSIYEHHSSSMKNEPNNRAFRAMKWRIHDRLDLEALLKYWELLFIKNEGILIPNKRNLDIINKTPILKLILPLLSFAKIRLCLSVTPILEKVWIKDWDGMNDQLSMIESDPDALRESAKYCLNIIELWIDLISVYNDAQKTSRRTPIFFLTCTFTSILLLSEYLYTIETLSNNFILTKSQQILTAKDTALFIRVSNVLKKVSTTLTSENSNNTNRTFSEFLKLQANGALDFDSTPIQNDFQTMNNEAIAANNAFDSNDENNSMNKLICFIKGSKLSSKCLYLGIRILADAPIWPAAVLFAEALKARSMAISKSNDGTPNNI